MREHDSFGEKIIKYDNSSLSNIEAQFRRVDGYTQKCESRNWNESTKEWNCINPSAKYRHRNGEWRNIDNYTDIIDWNDGEYVSVPDKFYVLANDGSTSETLAVDANGKEIRNYWNLERIETYYTLEGGNGDKVHFALWVNTQTYDTDLKSVSGYYRINDNGSFLDTDGNVVSTPLEAQDTEWQNGWERFIPLSEKIESK